MQKDGQIPMSTKENGPTTELGRDDYQKARVEVAFLLDAFASTIDNIMGGNTAPAGRIAGRDTARKLPLDLKEPSFEAVIEILAKKMGAGFGITLENQELHFGRCIIRELCALRNLEPGGALCRLFHAYFDGIVNGLMHRPVKSELAAVGDKCRLKSAVQ